MQQYPDRVAISCEHAGFPFDADLAPILDELSLAELRVILDRDAWEIAIARLAERFAAAGGDPLVWLAPDEGTASIDPSELAAYLGAREEGAAGDLFARRERP